MTFTLPDGSGTLLSLGDSIMWGQGLRHENKFRVMIEKTLRAAGGGAGVASRNFAHSGAKIAPSDAQLDAPDDGEVPHARPTVWQQVDLFDEDPASVGLVLVDGGINDIGVATILNPKTSSGQLSRLIDVGCHDSMLALLGKITDRFHSASVVVTGYYTILGHDSGADSALTACAAMGLSTADIGEAIMSGGIATGWFAETLDNCARFSRESNAALQLAVDEMNEALGARPRVFFADPRFCDQNACLAPQSWLWGIQWGVTAEDEVRDPRAAACKVTYPEDRIERFECGLASVGHPNVSGAQAYYRAILRAL